MPGSLSQFGETKFMEWLFGGVGFGVTSPHLGYSINTPTETFPGTEPSGAGYARVPLDPSYWAVSNQIAQSAQDIVFPRATAPHGSVTGFGLWDSAVGGNQLAYFPADHATLIETADSLVLLTGGLTHQFNPGYFSDYTQDLILNHLYKALPLPVLATQYLAAALTGSTSTVPGNEPVGGGYLRVAVPNNTVSWVPATPEGRMNGIEFRYAEATADWGTITQLMFFDAQTGGQFLAYADVAVPKGVLLGDELAIAAGDLVFTLD